MMPSTLLDERVCVSELAAALPVLVLVLVPVLGRVLQVKDRSSELPKVRPRKCWGQRQEERNLRRLEMPV